VKSSHAFTLIELLVVTVIIAILAAVLFPAFAAAKGEGHKVVCLSNFRQVAYATMLYTDDYDDGFMPAKYRGPGVADSRSDRTWVQVVLPYAKNIGVFYCPSDTNSRGQSPSSFDEDLVVGDTFSRFYRASMLANVGYNYIYLAPVVRTLYSDWQSLPRSTSELRDPSSTLLFSDSSGPLDSGGRPRGGGSFLILPPCRYQRSNGTGYQDTFRLPGVPNAQFFRADLRWDETWNEGNDAGGVWAWHHGNVNLAFADGSVRTVPLAVMGSGCQVAPNWQGVVTNNEKYFWDLD
jgi:prepilin-type N-terminal cleavage/methylation domain-containing protein/prepilin-type processing-associated H-X9-DG protein